MTVKLLTDRVKRDKRRSEARKVNLCQVFNLIPEGETIEETAQHIIWDNLTENEVKAIFRALVEIVSNVIAGSSHLSKFRTAL
ncbi:hypothetical protein C1645_819564 [Glomus cerebriforme]|uniref:Uncharacterized protein n=1 Tax=Glomus cerebriforme TaxID=658196 RepID=A0A397T7H6_9GLOM|nr:hypothetical protein C1645_819564 [Glomus cerebriforme]